MLSLVLSFAPQESTIPPRGGSPITRAGVGASFPHRGKGYAPADALKGFPLALWKPSGTEAGEKTIGRQALLPRRSRRVIPHRGKEYAPAVAPKGFPLALWKPSGTEVGGKTIGRQVLLPRRGRLVHPSLGKGAAPAGVPKGFPLALWKPSGTEAGGNP